MHGGHALRHAQQQLVPAQVKELGHREDAGHEVAIGAPGPQLQALLLAVDFQGNLGGMGKMQVRGSEPGTTAWHR